MFEPTRSGHLWALLGLLVLALSAWSGAWIEATADHSAFALPPAAVGALLFLCGLLEPLLRRRRPALGSLVDVIAASLSGLLVVDLLQRWNPVALPTGELASVPTRVLHNTQLHVVPAVNLVLGVALVLIVLRVIGVSGGARPGRPGELARSLTGTAPPSWRSVALRFCGGVVLTTAAFMSVRGAHWDPAGPWILVPIAAGTALTAVGEEVLFRGIVRPAAEDALGARWGNLLQAALFAGMHVSVDALASPEPRLVLREVARIGLWILLGWFFGLAARDTRGVGVPALMHAVLGVALYVTLVFKAPQGFLG